MGKKKKTKGKRKSKTNFTPIRNSEFFKDLVTPPPNVHGLSPYAPSFQPTASMVLEKTIKPSASSGPVEGGVDNTAHIQPSASRALKVTLNKPSASKIVEIRHGNIEDVSNVVSGKGALSNSKGMSTKWVPKIKNVSTEGISSLRGIHPNRAPPTRLEYGFARLGFIETGEEVSLSMEDLVSVEEPVYYCLVGYFSGRFPGLHAIHQLKDSWKVKCKVVPHEKGWVIFRFTSDEDRQRVLDGQEKCSGGAYVVHGKILFLRSLPEGYDSFDMEFMKVPLWVTFPSLPIQCWTTSGLGKIGSKVGHPICSDQITWDKSRTSFARLLALVDISREPVTSFTVSLPTGEKFVQKVRYELFPEFCCHCRTYGHNHFGCRSFDAPVLDVSGELATASVDAPTPGVDAEVVEEAGEAGNKTITGTDAAPESEAESADDVEVVDKDGEVRRWRAAGADGTPVPEDDTAGAKDGEVRRWRVGPVKSLDPLKELVRVWANLVDLPSKYLRPPEYLHIVSTIGRGVLIDKDSNQKCVLLDVDVRKDPLVDVRDYTICFPNGDSYVQRVEFEVVDDDDDDDDATDVDSDDGTDMG